MPSPNNFATHGKWRLPFIGGNDVRLAYHLPGKPASGGKHLVTDKRKWIHVSRG